MLFNVPIESLEERYSTQWNEWFPEQFTLHSVEWQTITSNVLATKIRDGSFLDVCSTNYFKAGQLQQISKLLFNGEIKDGDVFFFHDLWFPGFEALAYMRDGLGIDFKIVGILHAGTYDPYDFTTKVGMGKWAESIENGWFQFVDAVFVATKFHKALVTQARNLDVSKVHVTGFPIYPAFVQGWDGAFKRRKDNIVVFPHRLDSEKRPELFDKLETILSPEFPDWHFVKTKDVCSTKLEYYQLLARSKIAVSFAQQETWGIAQQEALFCGCLPVVPACLSYKELYNLMFQYPADDFDCAVSLVRNMIKAPDAFSSFAYVNRQDLARAGSEAIPNMLRVIGTL